MMQRSIEYYKMAATPIFQMNLFPTGDTSWGLEFNTKKEEFVQQVFAAPYPFGEFSSDEFIFPGEIEGVYVEFYLRRYGDILILEDERLLNQTLTFRIGLNDRFVRRFEYELGIIESPISYTGGNSQFRKLFSCEFFLLFPLDLFVMDDLYRHLKACFVGFTPVFGDEEKRQAWFGSEISD